MEEPTGNVPDEEKPRRPSPPAETVLQSFNPDLNGRQFNPQTTLMVRDPFPYEVPESIELQLALTQLDGNLVHYLIAPTKQEQLRFEQPHEHEVRLLLRAGTVEFV